MYKSMRALAGVVGYASAVVLAGALLFFIQRAFASASADASAPPSLARPQEPALQVSAISDPPSSNAPQFPKPPLPPALSVPIPVPLPAPPPVKPAARRYRLLMMEVTAYCPCRLCCGRNAMGITASGKSVRHNDGQFVAADRRILPFNSRIAIPGYASGLPVPVIDTGSDIIGNRLDVFFPSHQQAKRWGRKVLAVTIISRGQ